MPVVSRSAALARHVRLLAIAGAASIALAACVTKPAAPTAPVAPVVEPGTTPTNPLTENKPTFFNMPNTPADHTPVRVGVILPFGSGSAAVKALAETMLKAAELALYEAGNKDIVLMTADEGSTTADASAAAVKLLNQGAEIIVGPLFAPAVRAVAPECRDRGVLVLAFSTDSSVAGDGIYLMGFLPQNDVNRIVSYALTQGHHKFAALVPSTAYGDITLDALHTTLKGTKGEIGDIERYQGTEDGAIGPAARIAKTDSDAMLIPEGGQVLRAISPTLGTSGLDPAKVKLLGTGLWNDPANLSAPTLNGGWFAATDPKNDIAFNAKYRAAFDVNPPPLAALAYDAVSLVAVLAKGEPYKRFTRAALADPNGFTGADGIFRFMPDGTAERGLAVLEVTPDGFHVVDPAPTTFVVKPGS
jgi:branched-chain amino acid transport system substrate-binding protein